MLAPHDSLFLKAKKALISQLGPFPIQLCRLCWLRIGPVQAARLYSSIPAATHDPIGTISAPLSR